jgi:hypothetical protein
MPKSVLVSVYETVSPLLRDTADLVERWEKLGPKVAELLGIERE